MRHLTDAARAVAGVTETLALAARDALTCRRRGHVPTGAPGGVITCARCTATLHAPEYRAA